jgi:Fur family ferric uptake transcriptional regulator
VKSGHVEEFNDPMIERRLAEIAEELGYTMNDHTIVIYGERKDLGKS